VRDVLGCNQIGVTNNFGFGAIVSDDGNFESDPSVGFMGRPV
jgi:hypothetical protein